MLKKIFTIIPPDLEEYELYFSTNIGLTYYKNKITKKIIVSPSYKQFFIQMLIIIFGITMLGQIILLIPKYTFIKKEYIDIILDICGNSYIKYEYKCIDISKWIN